MKIYFYKANEDGSHIDILVKFYETKISKIEGKSIKILAFGMPSGDNTDLWSRKIKEFNKMPFINI